MDVWSIVGWGGSALVVLSLLQTRILRLRILNLVGCVILVAFNAIVGVWPMVGMNAVLAVINVVHLWRLLRHRHDETEYQVLQVGETDAYLGYILDRHRKDITRFNPGFSAGTSPYAFLVQHGDRTVGVVLAHDAGTGRAQIDLDYVVPKYRDFTPGEFVYRRSDVFTQHGFRQVLAPPRMRDSARYLSNLGFHHDGEDLVLNL
ncbi:YgjV family protein [Kribbella solani]|uniref:Inner membrane protein n=1 Tax=Kribbella solani TaxID=236067 RepID=A0A841DYZ1_9ACTN|nr:YgjV family protein [Kribbella solani]MBB5981980.1 hypothetical protein [Kribbella solani]MDX3001236.1 YgjV family protein [Kribbella solani]